MMFAVQARACCAWYMARRVCSASGEIRSESSACPTSSGRLPSAKAGPSHLGLPPGGFLLGDPADAVALDAEQSLDRRRAEPLGELHLDERHDRDLVLAQPIVGRWWRHADRLPDDRQQLERDAGPLADLPERLVGQGGEPLVRGRVEEGQRERAALDGGPDGFERDPGILERPAHQHAPDVAAREAIRLIEGEDAELDQPVEIGRLDPDPLGGFDEVEQEAQRRLRSLIIWHLKPTQRMNVEQPTTPEHHVRRG